MIYHALNRRNRREAVFHKPGDYDAFVEAIVDARRRLPVDIHGYCLMPNHFHPVLRPRADGDLGRWMRWLLTAHAQRYHRHYKMTGHVWQGRFKALLRLRRECFVQLGDECADVCDDFGPRPLGSVLQPFYQGAADDQAVG